jgi:subtilase-type serine protease
MALTGELFWSHFMGDRNPEATVTLEREGSYTLEGGELKNVFGAGLGFEAAVGKRATVGLNYIGAYNGDVKSSGVEAFLKVRF